jgi:uroporphyrinogen-III decarboxylase
MEASMKGYVNDLGEAARRIGDRMMLFGNINPYDHLERMADDQLEAILRRQAGAGRRARGFVMATGSPITMGTPLARVRRFIAMAHGT